MDGPLVHFFGANVACLTAFEVQAQSFGLDLDWLNTEFHRKKYSGLVRSESIPGMKERAYIRLKEKFGPF